MASEGKYEREEFLSNGKNLCSEQENQCDFKSDNQNEFKENTLEGRKARLISVEPVYLLILLSQGATATTRVQYIQKRLALEANYTIPDKHNCSFESSATDEIGARIQSETARWEMLMSSLACAIPIVTAPLLVAASDILGRKWILNFSALAHLVCTLVIVAISVFDLPLWTMLFVKAMFGLSGDATAPSAICLAYIGDSTTHEQRAVKMAALNLAANTGWAAGKLLANVIIQKTSSFTYAFIFSSFISALCLIYTAVPGILLETIDMKENRGGTSFLCVLSGTIRSLKSLFAPAEGGVRWRMWALLCMKVPNRIVQEGVFTVVVIIGLGIPFCWSPLTVGIYESVAALLPAAATAILTKPFLHCIDEYWLLHLGLLSFIGQLITTALARNTFQLAYLATLIGFLRTMPPVMIKYLLSGLVSREQQGAVFAAFSFIESISTASAPLIISGIYSVTVTASNLNLVFYIAIGLLVCCNILNGILQVVPQLKRPQDDLELQPLNKPTQ